MSDITQVPDPLAAKAFAEGLRTESHPDVIFEKAARALTEKPAEHLSYPELQELAFAPGVGSQFALADSVDRGFNTLAISFARQLIDEYGCKTASEIALAEMIAAAYAQYLSHSKYAANSRYNATSFRELDRAHRRFLSSLAMLRMMKRPAMSVNITTETAYVAQNQVNNNDN